jgi:short-subunit dehydrogenase
MSIATPKDGIAWITGASTGIGAAVARRLVASGWMVAITARARDSLEALAAEHPGRMIVAPCDVSDTPAMQALHGWIEEQAGRPVALAIFNAGAWKEMGAADFDIAAFRTMVQVNMIGTANGLSAVMPGMIARGAGQIAIVASVAGYRGLPRAVAYGATKSALISMAESLEFDLAPRGVTVNVVNPGFVRTPMTAANTFPMPFLLEVDDAAERLVRGLQRGRFEVTFPWQLSLPLRLLALLPHRLFHALVARGTKG